MVDVIRKGVSHHMPPTPERHLDSARPSVELHPTRPPIEVFPSSSLKELEETGPTIDELSAAYEKAKIDFQDTVLLTTQRLADFNTENFVDIPSNLHQSPEISTAKGRQTIVDYLEGIKEELSFFIEDSDQKEHINATFDTTFNTLLEASDVIYDAYLSMERFDPSLLYVSDKRETVKEYLGTISDYYKTKNLPASAPERKNAEAAYSTRLDMYKDVLNNKELPTHHEFIELFVALIENHTIDLPEIRFLLQGNSNPDLILAAVKLSATLLLEQDQTTYDAETQTYTTTIVPGIGDGSVRKNKEILLAAVEQFPPIISSFSEETQVQVLNDEVIAKKLVSRQGVYLGSFSEAIRDNEDIVWAAIQNNRHAIQFASSRIRDKAEFMTLSLSKKELDPRVQNYTKASQVSIGKNLRFASPRLLGNTITEIPDEKGKMRESFSPFSDNWHDPQTQKDTQDLLLQAVVTNPEAPRYIDPEYLLILFEVDPLFENQLLAQAPFEKYKKDLERIISIAREKVAGRQTLDRKASTPTNVIHLPKNGLTPDLLPQTGDNSKDHTKKADKQVRFLKRAIKVATGALVTATVTLAAIIGLKFGNKADTPIDTHKSKPSPQKQVSHEKPNPSPHYTVDLPPPPSRVKFNDTTSPTDVLPPPPDDSTDGELSFDTHDTEIAFPSSQSFTVEARRGSNGWSLIRSAAKKMQEHPKTYQSIFDLLYPDHEGNLAMQTQLWAKDQAPALRDLLVDHIDKDGKWHYKAGIRPDSSLILTSTTDGAISWNISGLHEYKKPHALDTPSPPLPTDNNITLSKEPSPPLSGESSILSTDPIPSAELPSVMVEKSYEGAVEHIDQPPSVVIDKAYTDDIERASNIDTLSPSTEILTPQHVVETLFNNGTIVHSLRDILGWYRGTTGESLISKIQDVYGRVSDVEATLASAPIYKRLFMRKEKKQLTADKARITKLNNLIGLIFEERIHDEGITSDQLIQKLIV